MKIATERRGNRWLAQVVHIGENMSWIKQKIIQNDMHDWVDKNLQHQVDIQGWQFYFYDEQDLTLFLLRWQ